MQTQKIIQIIGKGIVVRGNDIDTDRIIPARFLKEITFANMGKYAFFDERFDEKGNKKNHPFNDEKYKSASILVVNNNFGCGSSREHAPQSLMRHGIQAIIGQGFADIFAGNCRMIGLPAIVLNQNELNKFMDFIENNSHENILVDLQAGEISYAHSGLKFEMTNPLKPLLEGTWDSTSLLMEAKNEIGKTMARLPYLNNFN